MLRRARLPAEIPRAFWTYWAVSHHAHLPGRARAARARAEVVSNSSGKSVAGTYLKIPIRIGNPYSNRADPTEAIARM